MRSWRYTVMSFQAAQMMGGTGQSLLWFRRIDARLCAGLDPLRPDLRAPFRQRRCAQDRLGQHRRDQCAAHGQEMGGPRNLPRGCGKGRDCRSGAARLLWRRHGGAGRAGRRARPPLSRMAEVQGRKGRCHLFRRGLRALLAGGADRRRHLAGRGLHLAHLFDFRRWSPQHWRRPICWPSGSTSSPR